MKGQEVLFSKKSDDWSTPPSLYYKLDKEFDFDYDPCPYQSEDITSLIKPRWGKSVFCNPPYSNIKPFIESALVRIKRGEVEVAVFLIPARTDTKWFHELVLPFAEIRWIKGRLKFGNQKNSAPFPSMLCIFRSSQSKQNDGGNENMGEITIRERTITEIVEDTARACKRLDVDVTINRDGEYTISKQQVKGKI